jgi:hypothetical protein
LNRAAVPADTFQRSRRVMYMMVGAGPAVVFFIPRLSSALQSEKLQSC